MATKTYLPVWKIGGQKLGNVINVSQSGCQLFCSSPLRLHSTIEVTIHVPTVQGFELPADVPVCFHLPVTLCPVWQQQAVHPRRFNVGCELREVSQPDVLACLWSWLSQR